MSNKEIVVIPSYRADQYATIRALAADAPSMESTFQEWKIVAETAARTQKGLGRTVKQVDFDNAAFMRWAAAKNFKSTYETRLAFCVQQITG